MASLFTHLTSIFVFLILLMQLRPFLLVFEIVGKRLAPLDKITAARVTRVAAGSI
jgi:hypothetical protein